jgi:hypothetical protein
MALLIEAGQTTASDYVPIYPDLPLASKGASTEAVPDSAKSKHPSVACLSGHLRSETDARPLLCFRPALAFVDVYLSAIVIV